MLIKLLTDEKVLKRAMVPAVYMSDYKIFKEMQGLSINNINDRPAMHVKFAI